MLSSRLGLFPYYHDLGHVICFRIVSQIFPCALRYTEAITLWKREALGGLTINYILSFIIQGGWCKVNALIKRSIGIIVANLEGYGSKRP